MKKFFLTLLCLVLCFATTCPVFANVATGTSDYGKMTAETKWEYYAVFTGYIKTSYPPIPIYRLRKDADMITMTEKVAYRLRHTVDIQVNSTGQSFFKNSQDVRDTDFYYSWTVIWQEHQNFNKRCIIWGAHSALKSNGSGKVLYTKEVEPRTY